MKCDGIPATRCIFSIIHSIIHVQWRLRREDVELIMSGGKVLVIQPQAASLRRLNQMFEKHDIVGVNLFMDEADTLWSNRAGKGVANASLNERERSLYRLMGPIASEGKQHIPLLKSRIRTIVAVSRRIGSFSDIRM